MKNEINIIADKKLLISAQWRELWAYRELMWGLSYRDLKIRYVQTFLGIAWALVNPLLSVLLLFFVFGLVIKVDTQGIPPLLFSMVGLCSWNYFSRVVNDSGNSLIGAQSLVRKIYFPRMIIPISKAIGGLVDLGVVLLLITILMIVYKVPVTYRVIYVIPLCMLTMLSGLAFGIWISALTIRFRDFIQVVPLILRIGMFISPIAYGLSIVPEKYKWIYFLNPVTGIIEAFRWCLLGTYFHPGTLAMSIVINCLFLFTGLMYFMKMEKVIGDIL